MNHNQRFALSLVTDLETTFNCQTWCYCPGGRNSPIVTVLNQDRSFSFFNEQSAAFFAVGRIKRDNLPVAVTTTSGTAVAQLLPAVIESFYMRLPLILVTADRPISYRGTGAPQSINQSYIFSEYAQFIALDSRSSLSGLSWNKDSPLHLNISFDEPLIEK